MIEKTVALQDYGLLDMSGLELRKTLKILQSGNPQLVEWLLSPAVYREMDDFPGLARNCLPSLLSMGGMWHHYYGLFHKSMKKPGSGNQFSKAY